MVTTDSLERASNLRDGIAEMILVTGGTGLVGNAVARRLIERGDSVRLLARNPRSRALSDLTAEVLVGDVTNAADVNAAVSGSSLVIHAAGIVRIGRRGLRELRRVNVDGTGNVATACRSLGVRLVHVSSVDALGWGTLEQPGNEQSAPTSDFGIPYVITKRESQTRVLHEIERGLDATIVNPAFVLGPNDWRPSSGKLLIEAVTRPWLPAPSGGNDFCHADDVAEGILAAAARGVRGECYVLGGPHHTYSSAFATFRRVAGRSAPTWSFPSPVLEVAGAIGDVLGWISGREPELNSGAIAASLHPHHFDDAKARKALSYSSRPLEETAREVVEWFRRVGYLSPV
jgi:dihydroflavonol-4-reductase